MFAISRCWLVVSLVFAALAPACADKTPRAADRAESTAPPLHHGPLSDYVPAAGLRWMVLGSPRKLAEHVSFRDALNVLFSKQRLSAFRTGSGVDLPLVESALIAGFDLGTLYVWKPTPGSVPEVVERFRGRLIGGEQHQRPHPLLERYAGVVAATPEALLTMDPHLVAVAVRDPQLARVVEAFARGKLRSSPAALKGAALSTLAAERSSALATLYAPGPLSPEWGRAAHGLLANVLAARISVSPLDRDRARLLLELSGDFADDGARDLEALLHEIAQSSFGKLLTLDQCMSDIAARKSEHGLTLDVTLALLPLARNLNATVSENILEVLQIQRAP